jgi:hypothetical protein
VSHETIYRSLYIQARGVLKKELLEHLRARRTVRRSRLSYSPSLDSFWRKLSYSLHLLIGLGFVFSQPIDHGRWPAAKGGVWAFVVVELIHFRMPAFASDPVSQACR